MNPNFKFNTLFGLKLSDRLDGTYYSLLLISTALFSVFVIILSQLNYKTLSSKADLLIRDRYKALVATLIIEEPSAPPLADISGIDTEAYAKPAKTRMKNIESKIQKSVDRFAQSARTATNAKSILENDLPDVDDFIGDMESIEDGQLFYGSNKWPTIKTTGTARNVTHFDPGSIDDMMEKPFNYLLSRKGAMYIDLTDEMVDDPNDKIGYRDPLEIERVVEQNQSMIEHCFRKEARRNLHLNGFVKVEFRISFEGFVIPESIRIINSTVRSRKVEKCIKQYISRWRNFRRLDEEMGIARVVQKFVFN